MVSSCLGIGCANLTMRVKNGHLYPLVNKPGTHLLSIGAAAAALGVAVETLRRWRSQGHLLSAHYYPLAKPFFEDLLAARW